LGIRYTEIVLVNSFEQKAVEVVERNILVYFDGQDEMLMDIPEGRRVFKIRDGGNFCFDTRRCIPNKPTNKFSGSILECSRDLPPAQRRTGRSTAIRTREK
jgi:hypothetical protein